MINLTSLNWDRYRKLMVVNCKTTFLFGWHLYSGAMSVPGRLSPAGAVKNTDLMTSHSMQPSCKS